MTESADSGEPVYEFYPAFPDRWVESGGTRARGGGFVDGDYHDTSALVDLFGAVDSRNEFLETVERVNGFFGVVHPVGGELLIATDRVRSIPLFYADSADGVVVGTDSSRLVERVGCHEYDPVREAEYILTGYVTGYETLCDGIYQAQAGEVVSVTGDAHGRPERERYVDSRRPYSGEATENERLDALDDALISAFTRLIDYADGRPIVVSMSGGYDSRLLVSMLARLGYDDVITFTYDHAGDEAEYCRAIAENLGLRWEYVRQTHEEWWDWYHSEERERLDRLAGIIDAVPTNGPAIAIKKLREQERVPDDSVIVTGDAPTTPGERIPASLMDATEGGTERLVDAIFDSQYELWECEPSLEPSLRRRIRASLDSSPYETPRAVIDGFEAWDRRERQAKHTLRGEVYDFWDFDWWYPLWDREVVERVRTLPVESRYRRKLYKKYVARLYATVADLPLAEVQNSFFERNRWVSKIERAIAGTPLAGPAERIYRRHLSPRDYQDNPIWGIMPKAQFDEIHSDRQVIHAFRTLDVLGLTSFNPREDGEIPKTGIVTLSNLDRTSRSTDRGPAPGLRGTSE